MTNPILGFFRTIGLFVAGRVKYHTGSKGQVLTMDDGKKFTVFRHVVIRPGKNAPEPQAVFVVRFRPKKMSVRANIRFSLLPMMIFMGFSGFRSKYWAVDYETGLCQGLYEWQTAADAENYSRSVAMRFMAKRSDPVSVEWRIVEKGKDKKSLFELKDK